MDTEFLTRHCGFTASAPGEVLEIMTPESIRRCGRRLVNEVFNQCDLAVADTLIAARCTAHAGMTRDPIVGLDKVKSHIVLLRRAVPDISVRIDDDIVEGNTLVQRLSLAGMHSGRPYLGVPARGSPVAIHAVLICRINSRGRISEGWIYAEQLDVLR